jgi:hypothetical protein
MRSIRQTDKAAASVVGTEDAPDHSAFESKFAQLSDSRVALHLVTNLACSLIIARVEKFSLVVKKHFIVSLRYSSTEHLSNFSHQIQHLLRAPNE